MMAGEMMTVERGNGAKEPTKRMPIWDAPGRNFTEKLIVRTKLAKSGVQRPDIRKIDFRLFEDLILNLDLEVF